MFSFHILHKDGNARTGIIKTAHGKIHTPAFIPLATQGAIKGLSFPQLDEIGFESVMCNTYHLYLRPGAETIQKLGGLHEFMSYSPPLWTDSGGFQVFSLKNCKVHEDGVIFQSHIDNSRHIFTPEKAIQIQQQLGADIIFTFDQCIAHDSDYENAKAAMERTHRWAVRCKKEFEKGKNKQALYGIIQGGKFPELREESTKFIASLGFDGLGIGSVFGDPKEETRLICKVMMENLPEGKPKHFLGIGSVDDFFYYVEMGGDTFDCVLPTRLGRVGYVFIRPESGGNVKNKFRMRITNQKFAGDSSPIDKNCGCMVCQKYSRAYLRHLWKAQELVFYSLATYHNLFFFQRLMGEMREAIKQQKFKEIKERWLIHSMPMAPQLPGTSVLSQARPCSS